MCERDTDAGGLMRYLYGKVNEHTNQHMHRT